MKALPALLVLAFTITACSSGAAPPPDASGSPRPPASPPGSASPSDPANPAPTTAAPSPSAPASPEPSGSGGASGDLVLRVGVDGGLAGPDQNALSIPQISIYADGRVISQGAQIAIYPGPALPPLMLSRLSPAGLDRVLEQAAVAGLAGDDRDYPMPSVADVQTTIFTVVVDGDAHVVTAEGLGLESGREGELDATELQTRRAMLEFQGALTNLQPWLGTDLIAEGLPYEFDELRVFARPGLPPAEPGLAQPDLEWPLPEPLASFGEPYPMGQDARCGTVSGDDLQMLLPMAMSANQLTPWESDGERYELLFRPLLPDESGCPDA